MNKFSNLIWCVGGVLLLSGCQSVGPDAIRSAHPSYNESIVKTNSEQLLLNIVRLKYCETPYFLEVGNVVENRKSTARLGFSGTGLKNHHEYNLQAGVAYAEFFQNPTITFSPLRGEQFTKSMATPISMPLIVGLMQTGWSAKRVLSLCVERLNNLDNASTASGPTPKHPPQFKEFEECVKIINRLHKNDQLIFGLDQSNHPKLVMKLAGSGKFQSDIIDLKRRLNLDLTKSEFRFVSNFFDTKEGESLPVRTRSLMEVLFFLSHAVQVPSTDIEKGLFEQTVSKDGSLFDWEHQLSGDWLRVFCSDEKKIPDNAYICVRYRNHWFYIADNDFNSKRTFMLVKHLFELQSGNPNAAVPSLVIGTN